MSRAPGTLWSSFSGSAQPNTDAPVRITSIGCAAPGSASSAALTGAGSPRSDINFVLYPASSATLGSLPWTSR